jgi:hypothetical protein
MDDDSPLVEDRPQDAASDLAVSTVIAAVCIFAVVEALGMPRRGQLGIFTGPGFTPILVGGLIVILSLLVIANSLRGRALSGIRPRIEELTTQPETRRVVVLALLAGAYAFAIGPVSYEVATVIFLLLTYTFVRLGSPLRIALTTFFGSALAAWAVPTLFNMPMP